MNEPRLSQRELLLLIEGECNSTLSPSELERLALALATDATAQEFYHNYVWLDAGLHWEEVGASGSLPWCKNPAGSPSSRGPLGSLLGVDPDFNALSPPSAIDLAGLSGMEPVEYEAIEVEALFSADRSRPALPRVASPQVGLFGTNGWMDAVPWRLVGTCVFGLVLIAAMLFDLRPRGQQEVTIKVPSMQPLERYSPPGAVATLISTIDCRWGNRRMPLEEGASIYPEQLDLLSGTAEVLFDNGARVILEGPSSLVIQDAGRGLLEHGKLAAQVPKRAIGFTIATPTVEVVDYGTEFGVAASPEGIVDVAVLVGKIEVGSLQEPFDSHPRAEHEKRVVTAGQAVTAHRTSNHLMIDTANFNAIMATTLAKPFESMAHMPGKVVAYRVPDRTAGNRRDFHGGVGLDFDVRVPIRIFSLGVFDHLGDGIDPSTSPTVQLWSRDQRGTPGDTSDDLGREMLASQVFTTGDTSELKLGHRFKPLARPIVLPVGSYSVVVYDLADGNPFVSKLADKANQAGAAKEETAGQAGGTFARINKENYYGDTDLKQIFTLDSSISASGLFTFSDTETMRGKCFIGHFSQSTADNRREFIGMEIVPGDHEAFIGVQARIFRFNGDGVSDATSGHVNIPSARVPYHFDYNYDPNYEADASHAGPEGRLTLHVFNDTDTVNKTIYAINDSTHRDAGSTFDAFGLGMSYMEAENANRWSPLIGDDPDSTARLFIDDVTYSGHQGVVDFNVDPRWEGVGNTSDGNDYGWAQQAGNIESTGVTTRGGIEAFHGSIVPIGSRLGLSRPGSFPVMQRNEGNDYGAGSFEYVLQQRQDGR